MCRWERKQGMHCWRLHRTGRPTQGQTEGNKLCFQSCPRPVRLFSKYYLNIIWIIRENLSGLPGRYRPSFSTQFCLNYYKILMEVSQPFGLYLYCLVSTFLFLVSSSLQKTHFFYLFFYSHHFYIHSVHICIWWFGFVLFSSVILFFSPWAVPFISIHSSPR